MAAIVRIAVCDDMSVHTSHILKLLDGYQKKRPGIKLDPYSFDSGNKLLESINAGQLFDIYLLDIIMPEPNGIDLAHKIRLFDEDVPLVFLTQSSNYALDAFGVSAIQYILKPVNPIKLYSILDKIIASRKSEKDSFLTVTTSEGHTVTLLYSSIIEVESFNRALLFHLEGGETVKSKTIRTSFRQAVSKLLEDKRFLSFHQSFVINMTYVLEIRNRFFVMKNGMEISIPKPKYSATKKAYLNYLEESGK